VAHDATPGGLSTSATGFGELIFANGIEDGIDEPTTAPESQTLEPPTPTRELESRTLGSLPVGARLVLRCRADWRAATVAAIEPERVVLNVASPKGHAYRVRRPSDSPLTLDGGIAVLGEGCWRAGLVRYDARW
jgi:hypothetical protein